MTLFSDASRRSQRSDLNKGRAERAHYLCGGDGHAISDADIISSQVTLTFDISIELITNCTSADSQKKDKNKKKISRRDLVNLFLKAVAPVILTR